MRARIWAAVLCATDQEIRDGLDFYPGAHGLCRLFAATFRTSVECAAGVYAALSPMNGWDTNVANTAEVLRWVYSGQRTELPKVNTSRVNRDKAVAIARAVAHPLEILRGRKVRTFYDGIANPEDTNPVPVDRHLIALALGRIPGKHELSRLVSDTSLYSRIESAYSDIGQREGLGNRIASIAWFVQRRILRTGQTPMLQPSRFVCCGRPMQSQGKHRRLCSACGRSTAKSPTTPTLWLPGGPWPGPLAADSRGRVRIHLGRSLTPVHGWRQTSIRQPQPRSLNRLSVWVHPAANSGGWTWLPRFIVWRETGHVLRSDEHVHHECDHDDALRCTNPDHFRVVTPEFHGRLHAYAMLLYRLRDVRGRWLSNESRNNDSIVDDFAAASLPYAVPRDHAIVTSGRT